MPLVSSSSCFWKISRQGCLSLADSELASTRRRNRAALWVMCLLIWQQSSKLPCGYPSLNEIQCSRSQRLITDCSALIPFGHITAAPLMISASWYTIENHCHLWSVRSSGSCADDNGFVQSTLHRLNRLLNRLAFHGSRTADEVSKVSNIPLPSHDCAPFHSDMSAD